MFAWIQRSFVPATNPLGSRTPTSIMSIRKVRGLTRAIAVAFRLKPTQTAPFRAASPAGFDATLILRTTLSVRGSTTASLPAPQVVTQTRP